nr:uncharacterized protein LOC112027336 [Quercus suber]
MEIEYSEPPRSSEEEDKLGRSVKKFKENVGVRHFDQYRAPISYKDTLVAKIDDKEDETEMEPLIEGMVDITLSRETMVRIREPWSKVLIVKVFGRTIGYNYLTYKLNALWKPVAKMVCVDLGRDFFLIRFSCDDDFDKVLKGGPWFIGGHFLAIRPWEPYFKAAEAKLTSVAVWVKFPELPIEFYDRSILKEIGSAIGLVLRIDAYTTSGLRGNYARLYVQLSASTVDVLVIPKINVAIIKGPFG